MKLLFVDFNYPLPYDHRSLQTTGLGGTEASLIRIAEGLAGRGHHVCVLQRKRPGACSIGQSGVDYVDPAAALAHPVARDPDVVIGEKFMDRAPELRQRYPRAHLIIWLHALPTEQVRAHLDGLLEANASLVSVSSFQRARVLSLWATAGLSPHRLPRITPIHEPIDDDLRPDDTPVDPDKLVFLSSPHKGMDQVLQAFRQLRVVLPQVRLVTARPAYSRQRCPPTEGVELLGSLPHPQVVETLRGAFCLFYPQSSFEETFGLVFVEANAVGTPVLAHPLGAAPEVLSPDQLVDCDNPDRVVETLLRWRRHGRPAPTNVDRYRLQPALDAWERLFAQLDAGRA